MTAIRRDHIGPEAEAQIDGRSVQGRWTARYVRAATDDPAARAAFFSVQDAERWAFALAEGDGARYLAERLAEYLWKLRATSDDWPAVLHTWLADPAQWRGVDAGAVRFACGRIERSFPGGSLMLAWLGMPGVSVIDRFGNAAWLDTTTAPGDAWTPESGDDLPLLRSVYGPLSDFRRLVLLTAEAASLIEDVPDMTAMETALAFDSLADGAGDDLALFDVTLARVALIEDRVDLRCRWVGPALCDLEWEPLDQASGYRIEAAATPDFAAPELLAELTDGRQVRYRFAPPVEGARYYRVIPLAGSGLGMPSEPVAALPLALPVPVMAAPRWASGGALRLRWTPVPMASGYEVECAPDEEFEASEATIVYRGERPEVTLAGDTPPGQYYRVRSVNALYAPGAPSMWSAPVRGPLRLETPVFTQITARRLAWERVPGAGVYEVRVTPPGMDPEQGEEVFTEEPACATTGEGASYQVRALRGQGDKGAASEWSAPVTIAPHAQAKASRALAIPALILVALAALAVGVGIGVAGPEIYRNGQGDETPTVLGTASEAPHAFAPCVVLERPGDVRLPVYAAPDTSSPVRYPDLPRLAVINGRLDTTDARWRAVVGQTAAGVPVIGWVLLPDDLDEVALYGGSCDPARLPVWEG